MKVPRLSQSNSAELKMTPLIDVVFLLLIFFVWTSSFEIPEFDLPSAIADPSAQQSSAGQIQATDQRPPVEPFDEIVVRLSRADARLIVALNDEPLDGLATLKARLSEIISIGVQPAVIIEPFML